MADRVRGPRKPKFWSFIGTNITNAVSANSTLVLGANFAMAGTDTLTVMRMIGGYLIGPGAANVLADSAAITIAIGIFSTDAVTVGGTALPDPEDEPGYPWLFWASHLFETTVAQQDSTADPRMAIRRSFDIKSMRKMKPRETLTFVMQFRDINGAPTMNIVAERTRVLFAG